MTIRTRAATREYRENFDRVFCPHEWKSCDPEVTIAALQDGHERCSQCARCGLLRIEFHPHEGQP